MHSSTLGNVMRSVINTFGPYSTLTRYRCLLHNNLLRSNILLPNFTSSAAVVRFNLAPKPWGSETSAGGGIGEVMKGAECAEPQARCKNRDEACWCIA